LLNAAKYQNAKFSWTRSPFSVVERLIASGHDGIVVNGTTGESAISAATKASPSSALRAALVQLGVIEPAFVRLPFVESPPEHLEILGKGVSRSAIV